MSLDAIFVPDELRRLVSDRAWVEAMLEAERALANAESLAGVIPAHVAGPIAEACDVDRFDVEAIVAAARAAGNPAEPLVRALREVVGGEAAGYVHFGATSQDIVDTAAMLMAHRAVGLILTMLDGVGEACAGLALAYRETPMVARTLLQQAVPSTFGVKAAGWLSGVTAARRQLRFVRAELPAQLGGAAGTLSVFGAQGLTVLAAFAAELELADPGLPWHTERSRIASLGSALTIAAGACAKIGLDLGLLAQTEIGEVRAGAGPSSAMPQKRNPVDAALAVACARRAEAAAGLLTGALVQEHERAFGSWQAEWGALSEALAYCGGAAAAARRALETVEVDSDRMLANLELTRGAVMSERLVYLLGERVGRSEALAAVNAALERAATSGRTLREELEPNVGGLEAEELDAAFDPAARQEPAGELVELALHRWREGP